MSEWNKLFENFNLSHKVNDFVQNHLEDLLLLVEEKQWNDVENIVNAEISTNVVFRAKLKVQLIKICKKKNDNNNNNNNNNNNLVVGNNNNNNNNNDIVFQVSII